MNKNILILYYKCFEDIAVNNSGHGEKVFENVIINLNAYNIIIILKFFSEKKYIMNLGRSI